MGFPAKRISDTIFEYGGRTIQAGWRARAGFNGSLLGAGRSAERFLESEGKIIQRQKIMGWARAWLFFAFAVILSPMAFAVTKCEIDGKVVYQDAPCARETVGQAMQKQVLYETLYRRLDQLQARGVGMVHRQPPKQEAPAEDGNISLRDGHFVPMTRDEFRRKQDQQFKEIEEKSKQKNKESAARLTNFLDEAKRGCGGKMLDYPEVGMSDEVFRNCTLHARVGGVTQIVVDEYESMPLRLYVFGTSRAQRVYAIDGVITAIRP